MYSFAGGTTTLIANDSSMVTALAVPSAYVDAITVAPFAPLLFERYLVALADSDVTSGSFVLDLQLNGTTAGARCAMLTMATLNVDLSNPAVYVSVNDSFASWQINTTGPTPLTSFDVTLTVSILGTGGSTLSSTTSSLYLLGLMYNCSVTPATVWLGGAADVSALIGSSALSLYPITISENVDHLDESPMLTNSVNVYQQTFTLTVSASTASSADLFIALVSADQQTQYASGYTSIIGATQSAPYTVTLAYELVPTSSTETYHFVTALLAAGTANGTVWGAGVTPRLSAPLVTAHIYAVQDFVQISALPTHISPSVDSPALRVNLSTSAARLLVVVLADTSAWSASLLQQCSASNIAGNLSMAIPSTGLLPVVLATPNRQPIPLYASATQAVSSRVQLSPFTVTLAYSLALPASYPSLALLTYLADSNNASLPYSVPTCSPVASTAGAVLTNSVDGTALPSSVPYVPITAKPGAVMSVALPVSILIGSASALQCTISLMQLNSSRSFGNGTISVPYARNPSVYSGLVTLTSLPLVQHSDLYWAYSVTLANGTSTGVSAGVSGQKFVVSAGSSDSVDLSALPPTVTDAALLSDGNGGWVLPVNVMASSSVSRWLYVRLLSNVTVYNATNGTTTSTSAVTLYGVGSRLLMGTTPTEHYAVNVTILQPLPYGVSLTTQSWLSPVGAASSPVYTLQSASLLVSSSNASSVAAFTVAPTDALDVTELQLQQSIDCSTSTWSWVVDVNVSTSTTRTLAVSFLNLFNFPIATSTLAIHGATYTQTQRSTLYLVSGQSMSCSQLYSIQVSLLSATNASIVIASATVPKLLTVSLSAQKDGVSVISLPTTVPFNSSAVRATVSVTVGGSPRHVYALLMNSDLSVVFARYHSSVLPVVTASLSLPCTMQVSQALVGGASVRFELAMFGRLIPSTALDYTQPWQPLTFQSSTPTSVSGSPAQTLQDAFDLTTMPTDVDPAATTAPFRLSVAVATNGARDLVLQLFSNVSGRYILYATGLQQLQVAQQSTATAVTMTPFMPLSYGMVDLKIVGYLQPSGLANAYPLAVLPISVIRTMSAAAAATTILDGLSISLDSTVLDPRLSVLTVWVSANVSEQRDLNCSLRAVTSASATNFVYGSSVATFGSATAFTGLSFSLALTHLLYPDQADLSLQCYLTPTGYFEENAVAFSNTIACSSTNTSAVSIALLGAAVHSGPSAVGLMAAQDSSTPVTLLTSALAYSSGIQAVPVRPTAATVGTGPQQLMFWVPSSWALVTNPPAPVNSSATPATRLSTYNQHLLGGAGGGGAVGAAPALELERLRCRQRDPADRRCLGPGHHSAVHEHCDRCAGPLLAIARPAA